MLIAVISISGIRYTSQKRSRYVPSLMKLLRHYRLLREMWGCGLSSKSRVRNVTFVNWAWGNFQFLPHLKYGFLASPFIGCQRPGYSIIRGNECYITSNSNRRVVSSGHEHPHSEPTLRTRSKVYCLMRYHCWLHILSIFRATNFIIAKFNFNSSNSNFIKSFFIYMFLFTYLFIQQRCQ